MGTRITRNESKLYIPVLWYTILWIFADEEEVGKEETALSEFRFWFGEIATS